MLRMLKVGRHVGNLVELVHQIQAFKASEFSTLLPPYFLPQASCSGSLPGLRPSLGSLLNLTQELGRAQHASATQYDSHARTAGVDLSDHLRFLIRRAADHENNNILRLVARLPTAFYEWVCGRIEAPFDEVLQRGLQPRAGHD